MGLTAYYCACTFNYLYAKNLSVFYQIHHLEKRAKNFHSIPQYQRISKKHCINSFERIVINPKAHCKMMLNKEYRCVATSVI